MPLRKIGVRGKPIKPLYKRKTVKRYEKKLAKAAIRTAQQEREVLDHYRPSDEKQKSYTAELNEFLSLPEEERRELKLKSFYGNRLHYISSDDPKMVIRAKRRLNGRTYKGIKFTTPTEPGKKAEAYVPLLIQEQGKKTTTRAYSEDQQLVSRTTVRGEDHFEEWGPDTRGRLVELEFHSKKETRTLSDLDEHGNRRLVVRRGKRMKEFERNESTGLLTQLASTGHRFRSDILTIISDDRKSATTIVKPKFGRRQRKYKSEFNSSGFEVARRKLYDVHSDVSQRSSSLFNKSDWSGEVKLLGDSYMRVGSPVPRTPSAGVQTPANEPKHALDEKPLPDTPSSDKSVQDLKVGANSLPTTPKGTPQTPPQSKSPSDRKKELDDDALLALIGYSSTNSTSAGVTGAPTSTTGGMIQSPQSRPSSSPPQQGNQRTMSNLRATLGMTPPPATTPLGTAGLPSLQIRSDDPDAMFPGRTEADRQRAGREG
ncbi:hypothetical protein [Rhizobium sp. NFACC06-2]|uniref:hypothetical protein n=1 Tax=Rhizobium sp. NFACC06-2 TaxID=1566264 RepID=UPI00087603FB|nr:hypothetical protein [Rhizobium sp. NFACC06-2]SCY92331.1 hypothetical protein SAMN03159288_05266 [Rhizobium sp. NFACC06-2]